MKIGLIGTGKIGSVIVESVCLHCEKELHLYITNRSAENAARLSSKFSNVEVLSSNQEIVDKSEIIILALRTTIAIEELRKLTFQPSHKLISVVPSTTIGILKDTLNIEIPTCRLTPLPPAVNGLGSILVYQPFKEVYDLFKNSGALLECANEKELHSLWAVSALISPYYEILSQISASAIIHGASPEIAKKYTASMCASLSETALLKSESLKELGDEAKTPGGLNELTDIFISEKGGYRLFEEAFNQVMERFPKA